MAKQQINFRASELTARQLEELARWWGTSQTETITVAIDRIYQQEQAREGRPPQKERTMANVQYPTVEEIAARAGTDVETLKKLMGTGGPRVWVLRGKIDQDGNLLVSLDELVRQRAALQAEMQGEEWEAQWKQDGRNYSYDEMHRDG